MKKKKLLLPIMMSALCIGAGVAGVSAYSISMMTIHQSKGLEYKVIIILGCNQGILPSSKTKMLNNEEERRIFYVAITRAKERLFLVAADRRFTNGKHQIYAPSDFLLEMQL